MSLAVNPESTIALTGGVDHRAVLLHLVTGKVGGTAPVRRGHATARADGGPDRRPRMRAVDALAHQILATFENHSDSLEAVGFAST